MRYQLSLLSLLLLLLLSACNLGSPEPATLVPILTEQPLATKPEISIISPSSGAQFSVNEQILVTVKATDTVGVTRVQLFSDGIIVKTISSETATGDLEFDGILDFTPRVEGDYTLRVLAFRGAIASDAAEITVTVGQGQVSVTQRSDVPTGPVIPNDGLCRVLLNVNLNFRTEPTTTRDNVITVLESGTLALVAARLADFSWWKINVNNRVGWVSGGEQYTTAYGNCQTVPIENFTVNTPTYTPTATATATPTATRTATAAPLPDLIVPTFVVNSGNTTITIPSGQTQVTVQFSYTVKNQGGQASGQFHAQMRVGGQVVDLGVIGSIDPGEIITLTQDYTFTAVGQYDIRLDVDTDNQVNEQIEVNNRADMSVTVVNG